MLFRAALSCLDFFPPLCEYKFWQFFYWPNPFFFSPRLPWFIFIERDQAQPSRWKLICRLSGGYPVDISWWRCEIYPPTDKLNLTWIRTRVLGFARQMSGEYLAVNCRRRKDHGFPFLLCVTLSLNFSSLWLENFSSDFFYMR